MYLEGSSGLSFSLDGRCGLEFYLENSKFSLENLKELCLVRSFSREKFIISFSRNLENFLRCINIGPNSVLGIQKFEVI